MSDFRMPDTSLVSYLHLEKKKIFIFIFIYRNANLFILMVNYFPD